jgi:hypothetical protein
VQQSRADRVAQLRFRDPLVFPPEREVPNYSCIGSPSSFAEKRVKEKPDVRTSGYVMRCQSCAERQWGMLRKSQCPDKHLRR